MKPQFDMGGETADFRLPMFRLNGTPTSGVRPVLGQHKSYSNFCYVEFRKNVKEIMRAMLF